MTTPRTRSPLALGTSAIMLAVFWTLAVVLWRSSGNAFWLLNFGWIGTSIGAGTALFVLLPRRRRVWGRRLTQALVGSYMLGFLGVHAHENMQLERRPPPNALPSFAAPPMSPGRQCDSWL